MTDADIMSVIGGLDEISGYSCEQMSLFDNDVFIRGIANESMTAIRELKAENDRLKQENDNAMTVIQDLKEELRSRG